MTHQAVSSPAAGVVRAALCEVAKALGRQHPELPRDDENRRPLPGPVAFCCSRPWRHCARGFNVHRFDAGFPVRKAGGLPIEAAT
jgi:hypothetical protein